MALSAFRPDDVKASIRVIRARLEQLESHVAEQNWPQVNSAIRNIDDEVRYALKASVSLSLSQHLHPSGAKQ